MNWEMDIARFQVRAYPAREAGTGHSMSVGAASRLMAHNYRLRLHQDYDPKPVETALDSPSVAGIRYMPSIALWAHA